MVKVRDSQSDDDDDDHDDDGNDAAGFVVVHERMPEIMGAIHTPPDSVLYVGRDRNDHEKRRTTSRLEVENAPDSCIVQNNTDVKDAFSARLVSPGSKTSHM